MAEKKKLQSTLPLPFDLVAEILCRLPVKKLNQVRRVCKSWNSLISQYYNFSQKQLRLSTLRESRSQIPTLNSTILSSCDAIMSKYKLQLGRYHSTCDGILCYSMHDKSIALLFNPCIRKFKVLPQLKFPDRRYGNRLYTLVFVNNNYKVIALNPCTREREVNVYTFGTTYWTRIQDFPTPGQLLLEKNSTLTITNIPGIYVNDSVNWLTKSKTQHFIVSLDLEKESYQKISLPAVYDVQFTTSDIVPFVTLGRLRGCLSLLFHFHTWGTFTTFAHVWIMKEFGNQNSWTKLLSVPYFKEWGPYCRYIKVIHISEDDQVLMEILTLGKLKLVVYDSINKAFNFPEFLNKINHVTEPEVYVESLISPF